MNQTAFEKTVATGPAPMDMDAIRSEARRRLAQQD